MLVDRRNLSLHRPWILLAGAGTVASAVWYGLACRGAERWPCGSSPVGLTLGIIAGVIILFEFLLWPRKQVRTWRIGRAQVWMRAHIWLGLLCVPLAVMHCGFHLGGGLSMVLMLLFGLVIASGLYGLAMQQWLPRWMLERAPAETIYSQIDRVARQYCTEGEELVLAICGPAADDAAGGSSRSSRERSDPFDESEPFVTVGALRTVGSVQGRVLQTEVPAAPLAEVESLRGAFYDQIGPFLRDGARANSPLSDSLRSGEYFRQLKTSLPPAAHSVVEILENLCAQRRQLVLQARLHVWLHGWLWVHLPLSVALILLLGIHAFVALKCW